MAELEYHINRYGNLVCANLINPNEPDENEDSWNLVYSELQELIKLWYDVVYYRTIGDCNTLSTLYPKYRLKAQNLIKLLNESIDQDE